MPVDYAILGPVAVRSRGDAVALGAAKPRALLARLLIDANRPVPAERLIDDLWAGDPPRSAAQTLQTYVSQLRKALGSDRLVTTAGGYQVVVGEAELDAARFEAAVTGGRAALARGETASAAAVLRDALTMWHGPALVDAQGAAWAAAETARLEELRLVAIETLLEAQLAGGDNRGVVASAEAAVAQYPLRERLWALLMTGQYRDGRQADALRAFRRLRRHLGDELGIEPSPELQDLEARMLRHELEPAPAAPRSTATPPLPTGVVTFMLTDVVSSTRLWETAPAAMADAISRHEELLRATVEGRNGLLLKSRGEGDSTFSVFQRATDAVAAALDAQAALASEDWPTPSAVEVRLAVHSGEAVERDGDYYGRTVNRAARLRAAAMPGQVLVSQATADLVVDHLPEGFRLQTLGVQQLRDLERPETVFVVAPLGEAVADVPAPDAGTAIIPLPARLASGPNMGFVGREREIEVLSSAFKQAAGGTGRVVLIAGEPGIGKTAVAAQVARSAHQSGATVLFGRCDEESGVPHRPWIEAIGHLVQHLDVGRLRAVGERATADLTRLVPAVGDRIGVAPSPSGDPEADRWSLYTAVVRLLETVASDAPVVLVLDDLQWADKASLLLLRHMVDAAPTTSLFVIGTYRDSELSADHPFTDVLASLRREPGTERLSLTGLADDEVVTLVETLTRQPLQPEALAATHAVYRETDGNPFFVEALLRHLAETGAVYIDEDGRWLPRADLDEAGLPDSIREVIGRRVARLGKQCETVLTIAAVIGQEFDLETVVAATGLPEDGVLDALETAEPAGLVSTVAPGRFTFAHKLVATTLYSSLMPTRRARIHHAVGEAIEASDQIEARTAELARHWAAATAPADRTKAVGYARRAGDAAMTALAPDEALRWYTQALELLGEQPAIDDRERADLLVRLGRAQRNAGDAGYRTTLLDACRLAQQIGDGHLLTRAALANSRGFATRSDPQIAERIEMLEAALTATPEGDSFQRARLLGTLAAELRTSGDDERCKQLSDEAIAMARRLGNPALLAVVLNLAAFAIWHPHTLTERLALTGEAVELAESLSDRALLHWSANWRMHALIESGDADGGAHWLDVMTRLASETRQPSLQWTNRAYRAALAVLRGEAAEATRLGEDSLAHAEGVNDVDARVCQAGVVAAVAWQHGTLADVVPRLRAQQEELGRDAGNWSPLTVGVLAEFGELGAEWSLNEAQLGLALSARGDIEELRARRPWLGTTLPAARDYLGWLGRAVLWSELCERLGSADDAATLFDMLAPFHDQVASGGSLWFGPVAAALARLAVKLGRGEEAEAYFAEADEINERIRAPFFLARNRVGWARMLLARAGVDTQRATGLLQSALEVARAYDCAGVVEEAEKLLATPPPLPARLASAVRESFVGRDAERHAIANALDGGGCAVLVAGEPGIGKSALVAAAAAQARNNGSWIVHGRCDEDLRVPFLPFVDALTQLVAVLPDAVLDRVGDRHLAELERVAPNLRDRRPAVGPPQATDPETERYLLMNAVVAALVQAANAAPLVLVIDDLHWADKSTVLLLRHLLESLESTGGSHFSVLATYRHTDLMADAPFAEQLPRLRSDPTVRHLMLTGLDPRQVAELTGVGPQLAEALHRETDGNPFFAAELCRHLQETGADLGGVALPHAVRDLVAQRVTRQGEDVRSTLVAASAIGQEFDLDLLARVFNQTDDPLLDRLERAEASALVKTVAPGRFAFAHTLIQRALYDELPPTRRTRLHRQIALAIEELADREQRLTELARHWIEAAITPDEVDRAVGYATRAADNALEALAPAEAVRWYNQALELLSHQPTSDEQLRCRLLVGLTEAQVRAGDPAFRRTRVQAAELALRLDDTGALVDVLLKDYTRGFTLSHDPTLTSLLEEALQRVGPQVSVRRARLLMRYCADFLFSEPATCDRLADEAVATARETGDRHTLAAALATRAFTQHSFDQRGELMREAITVAEEIGDPAIMFTAYLNSLYTTTVTDASRSAELLDKLRQVVQLIGRPDYKWNLLVFDAASTLVHGDVTEAERLTSEAYELGRELQQEGLDVIHNSLLECVRWHQGRHAEGHELMAAAAEKEPDLAVLRLPVTLAGSTNQDDLVHAVRDLPKDSAWIVAAPILADIISHRRDTAAAALLFDELLPYRQNIAWTGPACRGPIAHSLAVLARTTGDQALAEEHLAEADAINAQINAPFFQARTWLEWADLLLDRGEADDRSRAEKLLHKALDVARARGYAQIQRRAERALASLG